MKTWTVGRAEKADKEKLIELFAEYLWEEDPGLVFEWKHENNPAGEVIAWIARETDTGRIAGTYFMMPWRLKVGDDEVLVTQCVDAVTHKDFRRKGIYIELGKDCVENLGRLGYPYSIAFPNPAALGGHMKVGGWHILGNMVRYVKPLRIEAYVARKLGAGSIGKTAGIVAGGAYSLIEKIREYKIDEGISFKRSERLGQDYDRFWQSLQGEFPVLFVRDAGYLNWKYLDAPHGNQSVYLMSEGGRIMGYVVLESGEDFGYIADMLCPLEEKYVLSILTFAVGHFRSENLQAVSYTALEGNPYFETMEKMGFREREDSSPIVFRSNSEVGVPEELLDCKRWILTMGDCDIERLA